MQMKLKLNNMKYDIIGKSKHRTEVNYGVFKEIIKYIDTAPDLKEAKHLVKEYQLSFGNKWIITHKLIK